MFDRTHKSNNFFCFKINFSHTFHVLLPILKVVVQTNLNSLTLVSIMKRFVTKEPFKVFFKFYFIT